ncbi:MAG: alpha/beta hydrolase-fold protein [Hyphomonadaceae bacterium]
MKSSIFKSAALGAVSISLLMLNACQKADVDAKAQTETTPLETIAETPASFGTSYKLPSAVYGMDREINIYVPEIPEWGQGYFDTPLHVLYVVDGGLDQDFFHIAGLSNLTLINAERHPMIVVGVRTHNRRPEISPKPTDPRYQTGGFEGWGGSHDFRRHLIEEVKPFVEARYETGRDVIIGESLAGLFIAETFLEAPESFDDYISISPSLWWDDRRLSKQAPALLAEHGASDRRLYLTMADEGGTMRLGLDELLGALSGKEDSVSVKFVDRAEGDTHASIYHHAARDALTWLFGIPPEPYGEAPWYLVEGGEPPESP